MENQSADEFSERINALASKLGVSLRKVGSRVKLSTATIFAYRSEKQPISKKAWKKLEQAEIAAGLRPARDPDVPEAIAGGSDAKKSESRESAESCLASGGRAGSQRGRVQVTAQFSGIKEPTAEQCLAYFERYLAHATDVPGAIGHTWIELRRHFKVDELERVKELDRVKEPEEKR